MNLIKTIIAILLAVPLFGQTGKIAGTITDASSGETLISSYIYVENTDKVEASDFDGKYTIELDPGTYTLTFTYIGFGDKKITDVIVAEGEVTYLDVAMSEGSQQLDEVVVTAKIIDKTENSVLLLRKKSDQIQDGLSSQEMRKFAVGNVASAVTKVTAVSVEDGKYINIRGLGDRYSVTQLNGLPLPSIDPYRNSAQLDLIPTNLLDNIITSKTFSSDQPGNFAGGNLNIKTKSFPEEKTLSISLSTGYNPQSHFNNNFLTYDGGDLDWLGYGAESRQRPEFFDDENIQEAMSKNAELKARLQGNEAIANDIQKVVDAIDLDFVPKQTRALPNRGMSISYGNSWKVSEEGQIGVIAAASYKNTLRHTPDKIEQRWYLIDINAESLEPSRDYVIQESEMTPVVNGLAGLAYKFNGLNSIDYKFIYNHNTSKKSRTLFGEKPENIVDPLYVESRSNEYTEKEMLNHQLTGTHVIPSLNNLKIDWAGGYVDATSDSPALKFFTNQFNIETGGRGIPLSNIEDPSIFWRKLQDQTYNGKLDLELPLNLSFIRSSKLKAGGFYSRKDRNFDENLNLLFTPGNQIAQRFDGDFDTYLGEDNLGYIGSQEVGNKTRYTIGNYLIDQSNPDNSYTGYEAISAAYLMGNFQISEKLKMVGGVRYEYTDIATITKNEAREESERSGMIQGGDFLPSLNVIYGLTDNTNLRASFNKTLARPNLREISPFTLQDPLLNEFFAGNPDLERTNITNADIRWEMFLKPGEIISASVFYKDFKNPIILEYRNASNPESQFANVASGDILGLELELRKNLDFISPFLQNFKFSTNVAFIKSNTDVNDVTGLEPENRSFVGQAPIIINGALIYSSSDTGLNASLSYNYTGDKISNIGIEGAPDIFDRARHQLDFILSKTFGKTSISVNAKNLLDSPFEKSAIYDGPDGIGKKFLFRKYNRGIDFNLTVGYKF